MLRIRVRDNVLVRSDQVTPFEDADTEIVDAFVSVAYEGGNYGALPSRGLVGCITCHCGERSSRDDDGRRGRIAEEEGEAWHKVHRNIVPLLKGHG